MKNAPFASGNTTTELSAEWQRRWDVLVLAIAIAVIAIDQITKSMIVNYFHTCDSGSYIPVIGNILTFTYVCNTGTAFSIAAGSSVVYLLIAVAIAVISWLYISNRPVNNPILKITFGLIFGGAAGNIIDRYNRGSVVDFIHFAVPHFDFYVFNIADSGIVVGMIILAYMLLIASRNSRMETAAGALDDNRAAAGQSTANLTAEDTPQQKAADALPITAAVTKTPLKPAVSQAKKSSGAKPSTKSKVKHRS